MGHDRAELGWAEWDWAGLGLVRVGRVWTEGWSGAERGDVWRGVTACYKSSWSVGGFSLLAIRVASTTFGIISSTGCRGPHQLITSPRWLTKNFQKFQLGTMFVFSETNNERKGMRNQIAWTKGRHPYPIRKVSLCSLLGPVSHQRHHTLHRCDLYCTSPKHPM